MNLNSRYAPVIALGVLGVVLVLVLGYFFAVKPQLDEAARISADTNEVESNTSAINQASGKLDEYSALLQQDSSVASSIEVNAPAMVDVPAFRDRIWQALNASGVQLISLEQQASAPVEGWTADSRFLVSAQVAALFQTGPVAGANEVDGEGDAEEAAPVAGAWKPVVELPSGESAVASDITMISLTVSVAGTPSETHRFIELLANPDVQLFQVYSVSQAARQSDSAQINGVADAADGDVITTITGALYFLGADGLVDESGEGSVAILGPLDGGFLEVGPAAPQPGG